MVRMKGACKDETIPTSLNFYYKIKAQALYIINFAEIEYHQHGVLYIIIAKANTAYG